MIYRNTDMHIACAGFTPEQKADAEAMLSLGGLQPSGQFLGICLYRPQSIP